MQEMDAEKQPALGSVYTYMLLMKEAIKTSAPKHNKWVWKLID